MNLFLLWEKDKCEPVIYDAEGRSDKENCVHLLRGKKTTSIFWLCKKGESTNMLFTTQNLVEYSEQ